MAGEEKWILSQIEIRSFLGAGPSGITVDSDRPLIVLHGPSGSGKSTIVSAIEWALFGRIETVPDYSVTGVGDNVSTYRSVIHTGERDAQVTLRFQKGDSALVWTRSRNTETPQPKDDEISCLIEDTEAEADAEAIFGLTWAVYKRGIAPRQTTLRNLVHSERADRNEALDHLFGIESLNHLSVGFSKGRGGISKRVEDLGDQYEALSSRLKEPIRTQFDKRAQARQTAIAAGSLREHLNYNSACEAAKEVSLSLGEEPPADQISLGDLHGLVGSLQSKADKAWTNPGPQDRMRRLIDVNNRVPAERSNWQAAVEAARTAREELDDLVKETGDEETATQMVSKAVKQLAAAEESLADADKKAAVLDRARTWLADHGHEPDLACPVCQRGIEASDLSSAIETSLQLLRGSNGSIERLQDGVRQTHDAKALAENNAARLTSAIKEVELSEAAELKGKKAVLGLVSDITNKWNAAQELGELEATVHKLLQSISELLLEAEGAGDRLDRLLRDLISEAEKARNATTEELKQAADQVAVIRSRIVSTQRLLEFLHEDQLLSEMDVTLSDANLTVTNESIEAAKRIEAVVQMLAEVAGNISEKEATKITNSVSEPLNKWFGRISQHDFLKGAVVTTRVRRAGGIVRNSYEIRATDVSRLNPVPAGHNLSGGYEMVLAVSALCAIQEQLSLSHNVGLFVLDEPTESLDPELEEAMGRELGLHAPGPLTIITTNRPDFARAIEDSAGAARARVINLRRWTVSGGTSVE